MINHSLAVFSVSHKLNLNKQQNKDTPKPLKMGYAMQQFKAERCNQMEIYSPELIKNTFGTDNTRRERVLFSLCSKTFKNVPEHFGLLCIKWLR